MALPFIRTFNNGSLQNSLNTISVLQFNCLADALSDAFPHVSSQSLLTWPHRLPLFEKIFQALPCDFICLQEVDHFADCFSPMLGTLGYAGAFYQRRPEPSPVSLDGVALFWKKDRFKLISEHPVSSERKTFGVIGLFEEIPTSQRLISSSVHLTSKPGQEEVRLQEMQRFTELLGSLSPEPLPVLLGGDFNDVPDSLVCELMRQQGFRSAYAHDAGSWTTWKQRATVVKRVIDYIWYRSTDRVDLEVVDQLAQPEDAAFPSMLPDFHFPSDHINIGAIFKYNT